MALKMEDLKANMCKWPIGDPKSEDFHFCGKPKERAEKTYCEKHTKMAYRNDYNTKKAA